MATNTNNRDHQAPHGAKWEHSYNTYVANNATNPVAKSNQQYKQKMNYPTMQPTISK